MPWRMRYLTTRDHPLAYAAYMATFLLGLTLIFGWSETVGLQGFDQVITVLWELQLMTGGAAALWSIMQKPKMTPHWPDLGDLLHVEGLASMQAGFGYLIYAADICLQTNSLPLGAVVLGTMGLGMLVRSWQAYKESTQAERLAIIYSEAKEMLTSLNDYTTAPLVERLIGDEVKTKPGGLEERP